MFTTVYALQHAAETSHWPRYMSAFQLPTCSLSCHLHQKPWHDQICDPKQRSLHCRHAQQIRLKYTHYIINSWSIVLRNYEVWKTVNVLVTIKCFFYKNSIIHQLINILKTLTINWLTESKLLLKKIFQEYISWLCSSGAW